MKDECNCKDMPSMNCLNCIMESTRSEMDKIMLGVYSEMLENWDGEKKLDPECLAVVKYCADRDLHPAN